VTSLAVNPVRVKRSRRRSGEPPRKLHLALAGGLYVLAAIFLVWPIAQIVKTGFTRPDGSFTLAYLALIFSDPAMVRGLVNAAEIAILVTLLSAAIALPLAVIGARFDFPFKRLLSGLLLVPLVLPPFVGAIGMQIVLGRYGPLTQLVHGGGGTGIDWMGSHPFLGIVVIEALHLYPVLLLNLQASLANLDPSLEQAAANLGASRATVFRRITMPLIRPGLFAGSTLVLIWSFTELGTPLMFNYYTVTPVQVFEQITEVSTNPIPYALVVVMLLASTLLYIVGKVLLGRGYEATTSKASTSATVRRLHGWKPLLAFVAFAGICLLAMVPHLAVIITSFSATGSWYRALLPAQWTLDHYRAALADPLVLPSIRHSLQYASCATLLALVVGYAAAVIIVRSRVPGRGIIDALCMLPLAVPGLVLAFGYLAISIWFKKILGPKTPFFLDVTETPATMLVLSYAARRLPYVVRAAVGGLQQTPRDLELAAANLGARRRTVLMRITIPLILGNLVAGALLSFAFAMLEVSDSIILAQRMQYYPITRAILDLSHRLGDGIYVASALGVWTMLLLTLTILSAGSFLGRRVGSILRI
jgi:iron(III) transport system permease protein